MKLLLLLSGPVAVGKTSVANELIMGQGFQRISTGSYLKGVAEGKRLTVDRAGLQKAGDDLDVETDYRWVVESVARIAIERNTDTENWLLDSVRKERQVFHFKNQYGSLCLHAHLVAPESLLEERYNARIARGEEYGGNTSYKIVIQHPNEIASRGLMHTADIVVEVEGKTSEAIVAEILRRNRRD